MLVQATRLSSVLVVGSINADLILRTPRLPEPGESLIGSGYTRVAGGKGANQAVAAARLGGQVTFVGKIGRDAEGEFLQQQLDREGIRAEFLSTSPSAPTGLAVIAVDDQARNAIMVVPGANHELTEADIAAALNAASYDALILQLEIPPNSVIAACHLAKAKQIPVILDAGPAQEFPLEELPSIDILTPNETETFALTRIRPDDTPSARRAAYFLLERSRAKAVVLKLGERGSFLFDREGLCVHLPAYRVSAVDTTAAGDAFTAALTLEYVRSGDLLHAMRNGNAAGALAAMHPGTQPSLPTQAALEQFCAQHEVHAARKEARAR